jgi:hypothetical protein
VRAEKTWSISLTHITEEDKRKFYRCNKVKRRGPQCAAQIPGGASYTRTREFATYIIIIIFQTYLAIGKVHFIIF